MSIPTGNWRQLSEHHGETKAEREARKQREREYWAVHKPLMAAEKARKERLKVEQKEREKQEKRQQKQDAKAAATDPHEPESRNPLGRIRSVFRPSSGVSTSGAGTNQGESSRSAAGRGDSGDLDGSTVVPSRASTVRRSVTSWDDASTLRHFGEER